MEPHDKRFSEFVNLLKSWISWKPESSNVSRNFWMPDKSCRVCYECDSQFTIINRRHHCRICGRVFCAKCTPNSVLVSCDETKKVGEVGGERIRACNYCFKRWEQELASVDNGIQLCSPDLSPTFSTSSLVSSKSSCTGNSNNSAVGTYSLVPYCAESIGSQLFQIEPNKGKPENLMANMDLDVDQQDPSPNQVEFCMNRSDDEDDEDSAYHSDSEAQHFQSSSEYFSQVNYEEFDQTYQSKNEYVSNENAHSNEVRPLNNIGYHCALDEDKTGSNSYDCNPSSSTLYNIDFENSKQLWYPPLPEDEEDERESTMFDDDDDDGYEDASGEWGYLRSSSFSRDQSCEEHKQAMKNVVDGHFRALIAQLLQAEQIPMGEENDKESWLEIITALSWEAATLLKPDTSKGGGMDPGGYVKIKCIASGQRRESTVVRGVVCKKNVAHRRMSSRIEKPRFLILGGALEYHRVTNTLSSVDTLLQQEMDHLKMAVAKIAAHHPSVLLVEKSVSRFAQDYLLAKNISLVLNIKRVLLERIARCTGAQIVPSIDHLMSQKLGYCDLFHVEKYFEEHGNATQGGKKPMKTLMFFDGCPKPLGCTILLKGAHRDELKKVKHVVQYGVFAAYHLALETSFLADEGASLPELPLKSPIAVALPDKPSSIAKSISKFPKDNVPKLDLNNVNSGEEKRIEGHNEQYDTTLGSLPSVGTNDSSHNNVDLGDHHEIEGKSMILDIDGLEDKKQIVEKQHQENNQVNDQESISEDYSTSDHQSILVSLSSRCIWKGTVCERAHLFRIKYYGSFDKPLGRFLRDNLFDESYQCRACEFPPEAHVHCYTHCQGSLTISVRKQDTLLPGERDGKIWMWHRCLKCPRINGLPPATRRVVMSDAAWGLSFGKFLELSFSNNAAASRVASCGHSLHRDCLRFYGFGRTVACFRYASVSIHSVYLPPSKLDFNYQHQDWTQKEADEVAKMAEQLFNEIHNKLIHIAESKLNPSSSNESESRSIVAILQETLKKEYADFKDSLQKALKNETEKGHAIIDILEINKLRRQLLFQSYFWDQRLIHASNIIFKTKNMFGSTDKLSDLNASPKPHKGYLSVDSPHSHSASDEPINKRDVEKDQFVNKIPHLEPAPIAVRRIQSDGQFLVMEGLSNTFDSKWSGENVTTLSDSSKSNFEVSFFNLYRSINKDENALKVEALNEYNPIYISFFKDLERQGGARLLLPIGVDDIVIPIYDDEPTSIISYVLVSSDYNSQMTNESNPNYVDGKPFESLKSTESTNDSLLSSSSISDAVTHTKAHAKVSFSVDGSSGKVKYSVTCYFAKYFERLRKTCCPSEVDFVRSLSRCKKWGAQGGKSNVFFAKSLDERFIIKQVTKTELESFFTFALEYFKYLYESISTGSPTCLAKILGIYQITTKNMKLGKETRIDVLVMENLLFDRTVTKLYDLKGSLRSRYNPDSSGNNKVLLDQNLIEAMPTSPIFLGNKAKRLLERAVWNDTAFLAAIDVMDYSLLVGVDEEKHELVLGIIDFMRQYTWDKHLETWVKASGILGGPKNEAPTIISPQQYKKRFRKAMSAYFLVVPDQWSPSTNILSKSQSELSENSRL